ncbi:MAG TPA: sugar ABC transporter ATP-binding protein [Solirubrobacteraceae bacterium]|nr:sugar ABC transporter ATP-binding protein [Solirubrobacteraceae bacterium]
MTSSINGHRSGAPIARRGKAPTLRVRNLSKLFAGQRALDRVDLEVCAGEVHALLGANGSGKSTLIKVLAGYHQPEPGCTIEVNGHRLETASPRASAAAGLRFIHQDLGLIGALSIAENLELGGNYPGRLWLSDRAERRAAGQTLARYGLHADPSTPVESLRPTQQTLLAVARAVENGLESGGLLVLDEPTASLPSEEVRHLFSLLDSLSRRGVTILYVTHRLTEVFEIAQRVTVLRDGRRITTEPVAGLDHERLVELILGGQLEALSHAGRGNTGTSVLEVDGLAGGTVASATFALAQGEIVGLTGLMGSGYEELLGLVFGARRPGKGRIRLGGSPLPRRLEPAQSVRRGIAYAPADRRRYGAIVEWTLRENLTLPKISGHGPLRWLSDRREAAEAQAWLDRLAVKPANPERPFETLSGGNQQRLVFARWLRSGAKVFLLDEPTFGVDAGAKHAIYNELRAAADAGAAVAISSSDTEELCEIADRILIMGDGYIRKEISGAVAPDELFAETLRASATHADLEGARRDAATG